MKIKFAISSLIIIVVLISLIVLILNAGLKYSKHDFILKINKGTSFEEVYEQLNANGVALSPIAYKIAVKIIFFNAPLYTGKFPVKQNESIITILMRLRNNEKMLSTVTIRSGLTLREIAELLDNEGIMAKSELYALNDDKDFLLSLGLGNISVLEGYIFPETYRFDNELSIREKISIFINMFKGSVKTITKDRLESQDFYEKLIIASIVEKEASVEEEKPLIASVIYNRLKINMRLELCPTVLYALGYHKEKLLLEDLQIKSPYNTYLHTGLPPTPIANPSLSSLKAAFMPISTSYLFYVSKGNGYHHFSSTYDEHLRYKKYYNQ